MFNDRISADSNENAFFDKGSKSVGVDPDRVIVITGESSCARGECDDVTFPSPTKVFSVWAFLNLRMRMRN
jgi:hypothetical protein